MTVRRISRYTFRTITKNLIPLIGNVLKPLAKSVSIPLGLTAAASATDAAIHKKYLDLPRIHIS